MLFNIDTFISSQSRKKGLQVTHLLNKVEKPINKNDNHKQLKTYILLKKLYVMVIPNLAKPGFSTNNIGKPKNTFSLLFIIILKGSFIKSLIEGKILVDI